MKHRRHSKHKDTKLNVPTSYKDEAREKQMQKQYSKSRKEKLLSFHQIKTKFQHESPVFTSTGFMPFSPK